MVVLAVLVFRRRMADACHRPGFSDSQARRAAVLDPHDTARTADDHCRTVAGTVATVGVVPLGRAVALERRRGTRHEGAPCRRAVVGDDGAVVRVAAARFNLVGLAYTFAVRGEY